MTAVLARDQPQRLALGDFRRHRHRADRGRRPRRKRRRSAGGAVARRRHRSGRPDLSRLRRPDPLRPPGARRLPARLAAPDDARGGRRDHRAGADRGRHQGRNRGLGAGARQDHSGIARCSTFPNRDHMRAVGDKVYKEGVVNFSVTQRMIFCVRKRMIFYPNQTLGARLISAGKPPPIGCTSFEEAVWCGFTLRRATGDILWPPCYRSRLTEFAGAAHGSASGQSARRQAGGARSDLGSRAQRGGRHRSPRARACLLHLFDRAASRAPGRLRSCIASPSGSIIRRCRAI